MVLTTLCFFLNDQLSVKREEVLVHQHQLLSHNRIRVSIGELHRQCCGRLLGGVELVVGLERLEGIVESELLDVYIADPLLEF